MTKQTKLVVYGLGGYDETKPDNNIIETVYYSDEELTKLAAEAAKAEEKAALLERLGITAEEAQLLLGGN
jgi:hypothetical protein